ncbi:MAG: transcription antitermination factor NusB [Deltaproteobacteria bacterium]|nr:transcription antitermination factor NusB [Deltaproteobacteria bacterium]
MSLLWSSPPRGDDDERSGLFAGLVRDRTVRNRADTLLRGLLARWSEVDAVIAETSVRWRLERMAQVDRNVLRLAAFELSERPDTPRPVVLAEAVRLARRYGSERSPGFVNGVAEALARRLRPTDGTAAGATGDG